MKRIFFSLIILTVFFAMDKGLQAQGITFPDTYIKLIKLTLDGQYDIIKQELHSERYIATKDIQPYSLDGITYSADFIYKYPYNFYDLYSLTTYPFLQVEVREQINFDEIDIQFINVSFCILISINFERLSNFYRAQFPDNFTIENNNECWSTMNFNNGIYSLKGIYDKNIELTAFGMIKMFNVFDKNFGYLSFGATYRKWKEANLNSMTSIKIQKSGAVYKVPVTIGGEKWDYIIDSGSTFLTIDENIENNLINMGIIRSIDYDGMVTVELADGRKKNYKKLVLPVLNLGNIRVTNIEAIVIEDGNLLLGKSVLNKFKSWRIDNLKSELILE